MADEGIMATTQQVQDMVGADASGTSNIEAFINRYVLRAENYINAAVTFDFSAAYSGLTIQVKSILSLFVSAMAANMVINYDVDAIGRSTATLRMNVNKDFMNMALTELKNKNTQDFMNADT